MKAMNSLACKPLGHGGARHPKRLRNGRVIESFRLRRFLQLRHVQPFFHICPLNVPQRGQTVNFRQPRRHYSNLLSHKQLLQQPLLPRLRLPHLLSHRRDLPVQRTQEARDLRLFGEAGDEEFKLT